MVSTQSAKPIVEVRGLVNRFGKQTVHDNLDLDIMPREVLGVVGGSGTGKSVLLRSIVGLRRPNAGSVKVFGQDLQTLSEEQRSLQERRFGVLFQSGALFSSLTVAENIALPLVEHIHRPADYPAGADLHRHAIGPAGWRDGLRLHAGHLAGHVYQSAA